MAEYESHKIARAISVSLANLRAAKYELSIAELQGFDVSDINLMLSNLEELLLADLDQLDVESDLAFVDPSNWETSQSRANLLETLAPVLQLLGEVSGNLLQITLAADPDDDIDGIREVVQRIATPLNAVVAKIGDYGEFIRQLDFWLEDIELLARSTLDDFDTASLWLRSSQAGFQMPDEAEAIAAVAVELERFVNVLWPEFLGPRGAEINPLSPMPSNGLALRSTDSLILANPDGPISILLSELSKLVNGIKRLGNGRQREATKPLADWINSIGKLVANMPSPSDAVIVNLEEQIQGSQRQRYILIKNLKANCSVRRQNSALSDLLEQFAEIDSILTDIEGRILTEEPVFIEVASKEIHPVADNLLDDRFTKLLSDLWFNMRVQILRLGIARQDVSILQEAHRALAPYVEQQISDLSNRKQQTPIVRPQRRRDPGDQGRGFGLS